MLLPKTTTIIPDPINGRTTVICPRNFSGNNFLNICRIILKVIESYKKLLRSLECGFTSVEEIEEETRPIEEILKDV